MEHQEWLPVRSYTHGENAMAAASVLSQNGVQTTLRSGPLAHSDARDRIDHLLLVPASLHSRAEEVLEAYEFEREFDVDDPNDPHLPTMSRFTVGLLLGIIVGSSIGWMLMKQSQRGTKTEEVDNNDDGKTDGFYFFRNGELANVVEDWNYDGKPDCWIEFSDGLMVKQRIDTDFSGKSDVEYDFAHGMPTQAIWRPNEQKMVARKDEYRNGVLYRALRDSDGNGRLDSELLYDLMGNVTEINPLEQEVAIPNAVGLPSVEPVTPIARPDKRAE